MANRIDFEDETHKYLIEVIRATHTIPELVAVINQRGATILLEDIPSGSKAPRHWLTQLPNIGVDSNLIQSYREPATRPQQQQQPQQRQPQQQPQRSASNANTPSRYTTIAPHPGGQLAATPQPQAAVTPAGGSSGKKRGRPVKGLSGQQQDSTAQATKTRPNKRTKQDHPTQTSQSPHIPTNAPSIPPNVSSATSPVTLSSAGTDSAFPHASARASSMGTESWPGPPRNARPPSSQQSQPSFSFPQHPQPSLPRPNISDERDHPFILPGISSSAAPENQRFFQAEPPRLSSRPPASTRSQPTTPYAPSQTLPPMNPQPQPQPQPPRYEGPPAR